MRILFIAFLFLPFAAFKVLDWVTVKLDDRVSITFPVKPDQSNINGNAIWAADVDSNSRCMAMIVDMEKFGLDSATVAPMLESDEFYEQIKNGIIAKLGDVKLADQKQFSINGKHAFEFVVEKEIPDAVMAYNRIYTRNIFLGAKVYSLSFYQKKPVDETRQKFFDSFKIN